MLCKNFGSLLGYAGTFNELGYYSVSLCARAQEVGDLLEAGARFEYLIYDGFDLKNDAGHLQTLVKNDAICSVIAVADVNSQQRKKLILWAKAHRIPLRGVLQAPLRSSELHELVQLNPIAAECCCIASRRQ